MVNIANTHSQHSQHSQRKVRKVRKTRECGRMWSSGDGGVDLACTVDGRAHTLRFRFCLDARLRVRLLGCGVVGGEVVRAEVSGSRVTAIPSRHLPLVRKCVASAWPLLNESARTYLTRFSPDERRMLDLSLVRGRRSKKS